jgi:hypothetical protein
LKRLGGLSKLRIIEARQQPIRNEACSQHRKFYEYASLLPHIPNRHFMTAFGVQYSKDLSRVFSGAKGRTLFGLRRHGSSRVLPKTMSAIAYA